MRFSLDGVPHFVVEAQHVKPGKGGAFVRAKLRNLQTESTYERTFRAGERFQPIFSEAAEMEFLYEAEGLYTFMDVASFEQVSLERETVGDAGRFLIPNLRVKVQKLDDRFTGVELPTFVELTVKHADPGLKGDSVSSTTKPVTLETGAILQVPLFVETGDRVRVDTRKGEYVERA